MPGPVKGPAFLAAIYSFISFCLHIDSASFAEIFPNNTSLTASANICSTSKILSIFFAVVKKYRLPYICDLNIIG